MFKRSLSRNTRTQGIKVKHVLQILVLLGICIWLIFQVKHSRDKKKELNVEDERVSGKMQNDPGLLKLGRKDLDPIDTGEKPDEEDEDETGEHDKEEENQDREERKNEETENDGRGAGDNEIDENDQENSDSEAGKEKDDGEGETERDEKQEEEENSSEERDRDENTRGAREEHYKGDDASSAVAHDAGSVVSQTEEVISDLNNLEHEQKSSESEEINGVHDKTTENGNSTQDGSPQNSILNTDLNGRNPEANGPDQMRTEAGNGSTQNPVSSISHQTEDLPENVSVDGTTGNDPASVNNPSDPNPNISSKGETGNGTVVVPSNSSDETESNQSGKIGSGPSEPGEEGADLKNGSENPAKDDHVDSLDLDTLPEIRTDIDDSSDETAAE